MGAVDTSEIDAVRRFNRFYTRRIGVLPEGVLDSPHSLAEVRVLYEIAHRVDVEAATLAQDLGLDRGYLSRILKRFESADLLRRTVVVGDARRRGLRLTATGRSKFRELNRRQQHQVRALLDPLDAPRRGRLLTALEVVEQELVPGKKTAADIVLRPHAPGDIGWVIQRHGELYHGEYGWDERFEALVAAIGARFLERFDPARERCWIAERDGRRLGCIFLVAQSRTVCKLRMLLLEPEARGLGLGRRLVDECLSFARAAGYRRIVLWTQSNLDAARHIYASVGFRKVAEEPNDSFAADTMSETWELALAQRKPVQAA